MTIHDGENGFWDKLLIFAGGGRHSLYYTVSLSIASRRDPFYIENRVKRNAKN
jgi:hypothetical protein